MFLVIYLGCFSHNKLLSYKYPYNIFIMQEIIKINKLGLKNEINMPRMCRKKRWMEIQNKNRPAGWLIEKDNFRSNLTPRGEASSGQLDSLVRPSYPPRIQILLFGLRCPPTVSCLMLPAAILPPLGT